MTRTIGTCILFVGLLGGSAGQAATFLDLTSLTPGGPGTGAFTGTLGGITVTGSVNLAAPAVFSFNAAGLLTGDSTLDGSSPQYSHASVYSPTVATTDRVGFTYAGGGTNSFTLSFSSPVTNPVFHVANLDFALFSFVATPGISTLTLLNGNGGGGDGLQVAGGPSYNIGDTNPGTSDATAPGSTPPTAGSRAAYGSVQLDGTFSTINVGVSGAAGDSGSFTISVVPEPGSLILTSLGALGMAGFSRRRGRKTPGSV